MKTLIKNAEQIVTVDTKGKNVKRGKSLTDISPLSSHSILIEDGIIKDFIPNSTSVKTEVDY
ncbi:MAG: imidazolonepropionase, partial [Ignavibacteria bacterium]|nr:imidazolonepropionase [Ignavibacteria bacterium]